ncbi:hypothetical protein ACB098_07G040700 [Castanea mollissima]
MNAWIDLEMGLLKNKTIDKNFQEQVNKEKDHWKKVLLRIIVVEEKYFSIILDCTPNMMLLEKVFLMKYKCNKKKKTTGTKRIIDINPKAFYTSCGCHNLNLVLCDVANSCPKSISFFGVVQRIYTLFSSSTKRWKILQDNVSSLTLKLLSQTRCESQIESVKAIKFQALEIRDVLLQLAKTSEDPKTKSEANCLATYELEIFEFLLRMTIWYDILFVVNSLVLHLFKKKYREDGFTSVIISSKEIATKMEIEPIFREKRIIRRKKQFDKNANDEITQ